MKYYLKKRLERLEKDCSYFKIVGAEAIISIKEPFVFSKEFVYPIYFEKCDHTERPGYCGMVTKSELDDYFVSLPSIRKEESDKNRFKNLDIE